MPTPSVGEFLRSMRARQKPSADDTRRRRTPGLRREEVAERAGCSVDWYVRLEQDRADRPSPTVLDAVARALVLSPAERRYLYRIARGEEPARASAGDAVHPSLAFTLSTITAVPALILGPRADVLETNSLAESLFGGFGASGSAPPSPFARNAAWFTLCDPRAKKLFADYATVARETVGTVRGSFAARPLDSAFLPLMAELSRSSPLFVDLWSEQYVAEKGIARKRFRHAKAGALDLEVHVLAPPDADGQLLVLYKPRDAETKRRIPRLLSSA